MTAARIIPFIVATIFMDAVGFGIIMPVLPQLVMEVGRIDLPRAIEVGAWIGLVMAVATFLASPVLGNLSDRFGRRRVLLLALGGLAVDYALLTIVETLPWLFVARALSGIFGGSYAAAQAAIADITAPEERARRRAADPAHGVSRSEASADVASEMAARDRSDRTRPSSPLTRASDAVPVDTTSLSIEQTVDRVLEIVKQAIAARA